MAPPVLLITVVLLLLILRLRRVWSRRRLGPLGPPAVRLLALWLVIPILGIITVIGAMDESIFAFFLGAAPRRRSTV
jgi:hypothetical protein